MVENELQAVVMRAELVANFVSFNSRMEKETKKMTTLVEKNHLGWSRQTNSFQNKKWTGILPNKVSSSPQQKGNLPENKLIFQRLFFRCYCTSVW